MYNKITTRGDAPFAFVSALTPCGGRMKNKTIEGQQLFPAGGWLLEASCISGLVRMLETVPGGVSDVEA